MKKNRLLAVLLVLALMFSLLPTAAFATETPKNYIDDTTDKKASAFEAYVKGNSLTFTDDYFFMAEFQPDTYMQEPERTYWTKEMGIKISTSSETALEACVGLYKDTGESTGTMFYPEGGTMHRIPTADIQLWDQYAALMTQVMSNYENQELIASLTAMQTELYKGTYKASVSKQNPTKLNTQTTYRKLFNIVNAGDGNYEPVYVGFALQNPSALKEDTTVTVELYCVTNTGTTSMDYPGVEYTWEETPIRTVTYTFTAPAADPVAQIGDTKYASLAEAIAAVTDNTATTITMIGDETLAVNTGVTIPANKTIILDLNSHTVTGSATNQGSCSLITNKGTLTVTDNSAEKSGKLTSSVEPGQYNAGYYVISNYGTCTIAGGNIVEATTDPGWANNKLCYAIDNSSNGGTPTLNITGGRVGCSYQALRAYAYTNDKITINISGGEVSSFYGPLGAQFVTATPNVEYNITGGTIESTNNSKLVYLDAHKANTSLENVKYNISGGFFKSSNGTVVNHDVTGGGYVTGADIASGITGGYFTAKITDHIAPGYACVDNTDDATRTAYPYVVKAVTTEVAEVKAEEGKIVAGETEVEVKVEPATQEAPSTLTEEQINTVVEEINTIITNPEVATFEDTKIDKATKDLTTQKVTSGSFNIAKILELVREEAAKQYTASATDDDTIGVTVGGAAEAQQFTTADVTTKITVDLTSTKVETTTTAQETSVVSATVSTMTFEVKPVATITVDKGNGETEVVKAVIKNEDIKSPITFRLPVKDGWTEVRVSHNGIYKGTYFAQGETGNRFVELASDTFSYWTVENNEFEDTDAVAKTGNRYYNNLAEALKDAANGDTVEVLKDTSINEELFIANKSITLDLGGFTVTVNTPSIGVPIHVGKKDSSTTAAGLTVKNGTINGTTKTDGNVFGVYGMTTDNGAAKRTLTLDGVTLNANEYGVAVNNNSNHGYGAKITVENGSKINAGKSAVTINGNIKDTTGNVPEFVVNGSTLKVTKTGGTYSDEGNAIYAAGYAKWDIDNSTITGATGIYAKAGTFNIDGGTITAEGDAKAPVAYGNGGMSTGDGIFFDSKTGYAGNMEVTLTNVNVSSVNGYAVQEALTDETETNTRSIAIDGGSYTSAAGKAAVATSETFDRSDNTTLTVANNTTVPVDDKLAQFTSFNVNYGDGISYGDFSSFLNVAGPVTISDKVNFATMKAGQQLIANFDVTMGTVSYKTGSMTEFKTIHSGGALDGVANDTAITFQIECGSGVTNTFTFTPHWASVEIPYNLTVKPISGDTVTLTVGTDDAPNYVEYGVYASVPNGTTAMAIGSYNFELNYDTTAFDFASFTAADTTATVEVNKDTAGKANVGVTLNTAVTPEVAGEEGSLTYSALLGTLKLKVKSNTTATTGVLTTSITNTTGGKPVVTPKGYDKNNGTITTKDHTQYLISFEYVGATGIASGWILAGATPSMPTATPKTGWTAGSWSPAAEAAAAPKTYTYTATHVEYTVTWNNETNPMTVLKGDTAINSGDKMYYEDTLNITVTGLTSNTVIRNGDFKYKLGEASATGVNRTGDSGFSYTVGPNVVNANVVLSYTTSEYVTVTFSGGSAVDLKNGEATVTGDALKAITLKDTADKLYASVNDFIKGNEGTAYSIPNQVPKANARLVPPDAKTDATKQQWKIGATTDTVANSVLTAGTPSQVFTADTTLTADAVNTYAVTFVAGSNGSIATAEPAQVTTYNVDAGTTIADILAGSAKDYTNGTAAGTPVVLPQTTPDNGYKFKNWTAPEGVTAVNAATTITGNFEVAKYSIGVSDNAAFKNLTGADATGKISMENDVTFKLMLRKNTRIDSVSYTVAASANGTAFAGLENQLLTADENGVYTIPKANILGDVTVTVVTKDTVKITYKLANDAHGTIGGTTVFVVDKGTSIAPTYGESNGLTLTPDAGYQYARYLAAADGGTSYIYSTEAVNADKEFFVTFLDGYYQFAFNKLVDTDAIGNNTDDNIWLNDDVMPNIYTMQHGTDAKFKLAKDANDPQIITSVTYSVEGGVQNVLLQPVNGDYTIPGDRIIGKVTVTVKTLADEVFEGGETEDNKISALFILRDDTMTDVEGSGAYMANVVQNGDMKILALVSEAFKATDYAGTSKFFQLANGTQLYWSDRYDAYVCWVSKTMTSADLDGFVKFDGTKTATEIINGGDINFDSVVDSADAGIVNDALHGTRQVPTSALQLFEMDVANTSGKSYVNGATIDANDVTWILKNTVGLTAAKVSNPIWAKPE